MTSVVGVAAEAATERSCDFSLRPVVSLQYAENGDFPFNCLSLSLYVFLFFFSFFLSFHFGRVARRNRPDIFLLLYLFLFELVPRVFFFMSPMTS